MGDRSLHIWSIYSTAYELPVEKPTKLPPKTASLERNVWGGVGGDWKVKWQLLTQIRSAPACKPPPPMLDHVNKQHGATKAQAGLDTQGFELIRGSAAAQRLGW